MKLNRTLKRFIICCMIFLVGIMIKYGLEPKTYNSEGVRIDPYATMAEQDAIYEHHFGNDGDDKVVIDFVTSYVGYSFENFSKVPVTCSVTKFASSNHGMQSYPKFIIPAAQYDSEEKLISKGEYEHFIGDSGAGKYSFYVYNSDGSNLDLDLSVRGGRPEE